MRNHYCKAEEEIILRHFNKGGIPDQKAIKKDLDEHGFNRSMGSITEHIKFMRRNGRAPKHVGWGE